MTRSISFGSRSTADQVLAGVDLSRKRVLVTGCNSAVGLATMRALRANGALLIGVAGTQEEAETACRAVGRSVIALGCDPTDPASVDAAIELLGRLPSPLDALIVNPFEVRCFADHVAQFVFVNRLAELVRQRNGRIAIGVDGTAMIEASTQHVTFDDLTNERLYDLQAFRGQAELATALFAKELSRRLQARGVAVNAFHAEPAGNRDPRDARSAARRLFDPFLRYFAKPPARLAATPALLAASPLVAGVTGESWSACQISGGSQLSTDAGLAKRLWELSAQLAERMRIGLSPHRQV